MKRAFASIPIRRADIGADTRRRFIAKTRVGAIDVCWPWLGSKTKQGYGRFMLRPIGCTTAQRVAYALFKGDLEPGLTVDHRCGSRSCVNPIHLEAVPHRINILRSNGVTAKHARMTHCERCGHELLLYVGPNSSQRYCPDCKRRNQREYARRVRGSDPRRFRV